MQRAAGTTGRGGALCHAAAADDDEDDDDDDDGAEALFEALLDGGSWLPWSLADDDADDAEGCDCDSAGRSIMRPMLTSMSDCQAGTCSR